MRVALGARPVRRVWDERPVFAAAFLAIFALARVFPFHRNPYICSFKQITGYPCFTCGMTRSWVEQVHGHVWTGLVQSPLGSLLFFLALAFSLWTLARVALRLPPLTIRVKRWESAAFWGGGGAALLANWAYSILTGVA